MGRARGSSAAVATSAFDDVLGARRGREHGNILAPYPRPADREELAQMLAAVDRGNLTEAFELLLTERGNIARLELLEELQKAVCDALSAKLRADNRAQTEHVLTTLGFTVDPDEQLPAFATPRLAEMYRTTLSDLLDERTRALYKVGERPDAGQLDKAFVDHFAKYAGAACFQKKDEVQDHVLGLGQRNHVLSRDVTAWRNTLKVMVAKGAGLDRDTAQKLLLSARPDADSSPGPAPRRRQRYVR